MQPDAADFAEWLQNPVTEWVMDQMRKMAGEQEGRWAKLAWEGDLDELLHREARVRADCYRAIPDCEYDDWKAIDDSED